MKKKWSSNNHLCTVLYNELPLIGEANYMVALNSLVHIDRIAEFNVLIYLISGSMEIIEDGISYELTAGTLFFLKSGVHHWGRKKYALGTEWYYIHFYTKEVEEEIEFIENNHVLNDKKIYNVKDYERFISLPKIIYLSGENIIKDKIAAVIKEFNEANGMEIIKVNLKLSELLLDIYKWNENEQADLKMEYRLEKIINYIKNNYQRNFTSAEIEEEIELSYKYISTLFKRKYMITIKEYQLKLRMAEAERLLCQSEMPIGKIAMELGFYDAFSFSKIFKREKGVAPREFRNNYTPRI